MDSFARNSFYIIAVAIVIILPLKLHADWSYIPSFIADAFDKKTATETSAPVKTKKILQSAAETGGQGINPVPGSVKPLPGITAPAADSSVAMPEADVVTARTVASAPRAVAPFSPSLTISTQLLTVDSEWRGAVYVDGGITVAPSATLTISPGTVVRFAKRAGINVLGRIVIKGTAEYPVRLTSIYRESQDSDWSGIFLSGTDKRNVFEHVRIEGAETAVFARFSSFAAAFIDISNSAVGLKLQSSTATIANSLITVPVTALSAAKSELYMEKCSITGGQSGVIVNASAVEARELSIKFCRLTAFSASASQLKLENISLSACQSALRLNRCDGSVSDSSFSNNLESGVVLTESNLRFTGNTLTNNRVGIQLDDNLASLWANTISGNSSYNLIYLGEESLFVGGNSFGGKTAGENENKVFSKRPGAVQMVPLFATEPSRNGNSFKVPY